MTPTEKDRLVEQLVDTALDERPERRAAYLDEACRDRPELRAEVESLLRWNEQARDFIERPAIHANAEKLFGNDHVETVATLRPGESLGNYKIISLIGEGGMGEVYLADHVQLGRRVALKLVRQGLVLRSLINRFRYEERILAGLNHPNIGRLYDAAITADGSPYFVMEYVEGERLDEYCDKRTLSIKARLELFLKICAAVGYAHQHLVIHRDIKPANIRVTNEGEPKLLDFGIARLLDAETAATAGDTIAIHGIMTPEYASPEQIRGEPVTTASDIYSLGIVLYELLTGQKPFPAPTRPQDEAKQPPARPSTALTRAKSRLPIETRDPKALRGDLDNIVLMAMRQEPARRYSSVGEFSEDIRRHLAGRTVIARKDTWSYRASKFVRRNKTGVIAAALVVLALLAGIVATSWQAQVAKAERAKAERRFNEVRHLANSSLFELHDAIEKLPGSTAARELLVKNALEYLDRLGQEARDDPSLQRELTSAYLKVGNVQGNPNNANLGNPAGALLSYRKALVLAERLVATASNAEEAAQARRLLAVVHEKTADVLAVTGQISSAVQYSNSSLQIFQSLADAQPANIKARQSLAISRIKSGDVLGNPNFPNAGDVAAALRNYQASLAIWTSLTNAAPRDTTDRRFLGLTYERIGTMLETQEKFSEALANYRQSLAIREALSRDFPADSDAVRDVAIIHEKLANVLTANGNLAGALDDRQTSLEILKRLVAADPQNMQARQSLAISYVHLGDLFGYPDVPNLQRLSDAREAYRRALETLSSAREIESADAKTREILSSIHERNGAMAAANANVDDALKEYREAFRITENLTTDPSSLQEMTKICTKLGEIFVARASNPATTRDQQKDAWREAQSWYERSLTAWKNLRSRGIFGKRDAEKLQGVEDDLKKCTDALARLR